MTVPLARPEPPDLKEMTVRRVRRVLQTALCDLRDRRPSVFYGSVFNQPAANQP